MAGKDDDEIDYSAWMTEESEDEEPSSTSRHYGPQNFQLRRPRRRASATNVPIYMNELFKTRELLLSPLKKSKKADAVEIRVPSAGEPQSTISLRNSIRIGLLWMQETNFGNFERAFNEAYEYISAAAEMRELEVFDHPLRTNPYRALLNRIVYLGQQINRLVEESDNALDAMENLNMSYDQLRRVSTTSNFSTTLFREIYAEILLINEIAKTMLTIGKAEVYFSGQDSRLQFLIQENTIIPRLQTIQSLYKSILVILDACKAFGLRVLQDIRSIFARMLQNPVYSSNNRLLGPFSQRLDNKAIEQLESIRNMDSLVDSPRIRSSRGILLQYLKQLMIYLKNMVELRIIAFKQNENFEGSVQEPEPLNRKISTNFNDTTKRWNDYFEWKEKAERVIRDLSSHRYTDYQHRTLKVTSEKRTPASFPSKGRALKRPAIPWGSMTPSPSSSPMRDSQPPSPGPFIVPETEDHTQEPISNESIPDHELLTFDDSLEQRYIVVQLGDPDEQRSWRNIPGGATGHSIASAAVSTPPIHADVSDEDYEPAPDLEPLMFHDQLEQFYIVAQLGDPDEQTSWRNIPGGSMGHSIASTAASAPPSDTDVSDEDYEPPPKRSKKKE